MVKECKECTQGNCTKIKGQYEAAQSARAHGALRFSGINWMLIDFPTREQAQAFVGTLCSQNWEGLYSNVIAQTQDGLFNVRIR
jgi:hypothetical protein